jgi:hypothetical protein
MTAEEKMIRDLVAELHKENPKATEKELLKLFKARVKDDKELTRAVFRVCFDDAWRRYGRS